jgi:hypothetical protein
VDRKEAKMIKREGPEKFVLFSKDGSRRLGEFRSRKQAEDRERQIMQIKSLKRRDAKRN